MSVWLTNKLAKACRVIPAPIRRRLDFIGWIAEKIPARADKRYRDHPDPLLRGDLLEYGLKKFPPAHYPTMWTEAPADLRRPMFWHGKLLNGENPAEIAKSQLTDQVMVGTIRNAGYFALVQTIIGTLFMFCVAFGYSDTLQMFSFVGGVTPFPEWAAQEGLLLPIAAWLLLRALETVWFGFWTLLPVLPLILIGFVINWSAAAHHAFSNWWARASHALRIPTREALLLYQKDPRVRWSIYSAYCRAVDQARTRLKDLPLIPVGRATGILQGRGDLESPSNGQIVCFDGESLRQHTLILGGTGSGKTRLVIRPMFRRIFEADWGTGHRMGAYVTDGKGNLWKDLLPVVSYRDDIVVLGTGDDQYGVDLLKGMSPLEVATTFKAVAGQVSGGGGKDDFWPESASLLLMHAATLALVLETSDEHAQEFTEKYYCRPYSLLGVALIASREIVANEVISLVLKQINLNLEAQRDRFQHDSADYKKLNQLVMSAQTSAGYMLESFFPLAVETKGSIIANVNVVLGKLEGAHEIADRFGRGTFPRMIDVDYALNGGIVMVAVGETEHGMAGRVINCWLKTRLYILARRRMVENPEAAKNTSCAMVADEFQMLATIGPDSDASFWNVARESGMFLIAATQSVAALNQAIGESATANLMNLLRSKIILKTEEESTLRYVQALAGEYLSGWDEDSGRLYPTISRLIQDHGYPNYRVPGTVSHTFFLPRSFRASTAFHAIYSVSERLIQEANSLINAFIDPSGTTSNLSRLYHEMERAEQKSREALKGNLQYRPKVSVDELLMGGGYAFAIVQRAGVDAMDIIDLRIDE